MAQACNEKQKWLENPHWVGRCAVEEDRPIGNFITIGQKMRRAPAAAHLSEPYFPFYIEVIVSRIYFLFIFSYFCRLGPMCVPTGDRRRSWSC